MTTLYRQVFRPFLFLLSTLISTCALAQNVTVRGQVLVASSHEPIQYANVQVWNADSVLVTGGITDQKGNYTLTDIKVRSFTLKIHQLGYGIVKVAHTLASPVNLFDVPTIYLTETAGNLEEVTVKADRATTSVRLDKQVIDAKKFQTAGNGTGLDLLQKMPSVTVTNEGEIALRGNTGFIVLINGKPSNRIAADILAQLPANVIDNVEIITSPSARYDADGKSGVINIITKKDVGTGWSLSGNSMVGGADPLRFGGDLQLNYTGKKWSAYASGDYRRYDIDGRRIGEVRTVYKDTLTYLPSDGIRNYRDEQYSFRTGASFNPDANNSWKVAFYTGYKQTDRTANLHYRDYYRTQLSTANLFDNGFSAPTSQFFNKNLFVRSGQFTTANLDYTHTFANKSKYTLLGIYEYSVLGGPLDNSDEREGTNSPYFIERSVESSPLHAIRLQGDYSLSVAKGKLGFGAVFRHFNQSGTFDYVRKTSVFEVGYKDPEFNDNVMTRQQITAGYVQFDKTQKAVAYSVGLRLEQMNRALNDARTETTYRFDQLNFFPSAQLMWTLPRQQDIRFGYNRRIDWPTVKSLLPFKNHRHKETIEMGDPNLKPEIADVVDMTYSKSWPNLKLVATAYVNHVQNKVFRTNQIYDRTILTRIYTNAGNSTSTGIELSGDVKLKNWWRVYVGGNLYNFDVRGMLDGVSFHTASVNYNLNANTSLTISKLLKFQCDLTYVSATVTSQGNDSKLLLSNAGFRYNTWQNKGTLGVQLNNIFQSNSQEITTRTANFYSYTDYIKYDRVLQISLSFRLNESAKKAKAAKTEFGEKEF